MYHLSAQDIRDRMIKRHCYYYISVIGLSKFSHPLNPRRTHLNSARAQKQKHSRQPGFRFRFFSGRAFRSTGLIDVNMVLNVHRNHKVY